METKLNGITLKIYPDYSPLNPRKDCEHLGTLLIWHPHYALGDTEQYSTPQDFYESEEYKKVFASIPVYLLDHSGLRLSCCDFNDRWDSGRVGIIYCTKDDAQTWLGKCTPEEAVKILRQEIEEYDLFLNSDFYEYRVEGYDGEILDCCGGFINISSEIDLVDRMKEFTPKSFHPLFKKLKRQIQSGAYM